MPSNEDRQRIFAEIGRIKNRISQIRNKRSENRDELAQLREAQHDFRREAMKRHNRDVGYQGGDCDARIGMIYSENNDLSSELDDLYVKKTALYGRLNGEGNSHDE